MRASVALATLALCAFAGTALGQQAAAGDAKRGKERSYTCLGCHGIESYQNAYPTYSVPELKGQHPEYLATALQGYRDGDRSHVTMHSQSSTLSDQDILDIATFLAGKALATSGKPPANVPQAAAVCTSCHGGDGIAIAPMYPSLAGQREDYLVRAIDEYRKGGRKNPIMKGFAGPLKDEDVEVIAKYFSHLTPGLEVEERPATSLRK